MRGPGRLMSQSVLVALLVAVWAQAMEAQSPLKWVRKSLGPGGSGPIAVDARGNPHVLFGRDIDGVAWLLHGWAEGSKWKTEAVLARYSAGLGGLTVDGAGALHVACGGDVPGQGTVLAYAHTVDGVWQSEVVTAGGVAASIAIDDEGHAGIVHLLAQPPFDVLYSHQTSEGWETEVVASQALTFGGTSANLRDGKVYATFSDGNLPRRLYLAVRDAGLWSVQEVDEGRAGTAAFDQDGVLHLVYQQEATALRHAWLSESGWEYETLISTTEVFGEPVPQGFTAVGEYPALVAEATGRLHLANGLYVSRGDAWTEALLASTFDGASWSPSVVNAKRVGFDNAIAVDARGIVYVSTRKAGGGAGARHLIYRVKGARLSMSVVPKEAGAITVSPSGTVCTSHASEVWRPGSELTLTVEAAPGFAFEKWTGALAGTEPFGELAVLENRKVVAHFRPQP